MVGETWDNWKDSVRRTIELGPDSVTIYQMELPFNTVYSQGHARQQQVETPVADWPTKRAWVDYAFDELQAAGYTVSSAYTMVRDQAKVNFSYRDNLWHGADLLATGVASFGHVSGVHYQNQPDWAGYVGALERGELPLVARHAADAAPIAGPRDDLAAQDRHAGGRLFPPQVRRRHRRALGGSLAAIPGRWLFGNRRRHDPSDPRRAAAGRQFVTRLFRAPTSASALYLNRRLPPPHDSAPPTAADGPARVEASLPTVGHFPTFGFRR